MGGKGPVRPAAHACVLTYLEASVGIALFSCRVCRSAPLLAANRCSSHALSQDAERMKIRPEDKREIVIQRLDEFGREARAPALLPLDACPISTG